jgi:hypothetical protein
MGTTSRPAGCYTPFQPTQGITRSKLQRQEARSKKEKSNQESRLHEYKWSSQRSNLNWLEEVATETVLMQEASAMRLHE